MLALRIPISEICEGENLFDWELKPGELDIEYPGAAFSSPVKIHIDIFRSGGEITVDVSVRTKLMLDCARCLKPFESEFDSSFSVYVKLVRGGEPFTNFADEDFAMLDATNGLIDFAGRIRTEIILDLPRIPLCKPDCPGIPYAGKTEKKIDERWEALKALKKNIDKKENKDIKKKG